MAEFKYEAIAQVYARLIKEGKRTLESITNLEIKTRVQQILQTK